ncbi:glycosyltransferase [Salidesulfovibrio onnuriiensis]|uniref:glycosyltransferase n=1 Tax=Salidesulfovibrio onnuriiensis TaxID=2583823 RepID=UPI0011CC1BAE|nr:glycosyltransferase [Salidesulfovibrio onnuriiensis]
MPLAVHHHTALQLRGGAVRVAELLHRELDKAGHACTRSFELAETGGGRETPPQEVGAAVPKGTLLHLHSTGDWVRLLSGLKQTPLLTLHDCDLFTGGCPYPLDCGHFFNDCLEPCPRNFPECFGYREAKRILVDQTRPVFVSPSGWLARLAREALPGHKVRVIPNGVPWPDAPPDREGARKTLGIHPAARVALFVAHGGAMAAYKSGDRWQGLWDELKVRVPNLLGFAVGGDKAGQENDLHTWPYLDRERMLLLMAAADALLYPSLADNHPLVVLEAMSRALPVVAFAAGGIPEQVTPGETGVLVKERDYSAFVETAASLLGRARLMRDMGMNAHATGAQRFSVERMAAAYEKEYEALAAMNQRPLNKEMH